MVDSIHPGFELSKLEGDAAFTFKIADEIDGSNLLDTIEQCYFRFRRRRRDINQATTCECNACRRIPGLDLKFVVHHGDAIIQEIAGRSELMGVDSIVVHRMLKNDVVESLGVSAYALISQAAIDASDLDPEALGMLSHDVSYEDIGDVPAFVHDLEARWIEEQDRVRVRVGPDDAALDLSITTAAPRQVAWEFLTAPGQRMSWQPWVTQVEVEGLRGGRRGVGSANHCMHGEDAVVEEILDWRPYDYVTDRTVLDLPGGEVKILHTIEFEPLADGTTIHMRFGPPETERERQAMQDIGPSYQQALEGAFPQLLTQMEEKAHIASGE